MAKSQLLASTILSDDDTLDKVTNDILTELGISKDNMKDNWLSNIIGQLNYAINLMNENLDKIKESNTDIKGIKDFQKGFRNLQILVPKIRSYILGQEVNVMYLKVTESGTTLFLIPESELYKYSIITNYDKTNKVFWANPSQEALNNLDNKIALEQLDGKTSILENSILSHMSKNVPVASNFNSSYRTINGQVYLKSSAHEDIGDKNFCYISKTADTDRRKGYYYAVGDDNMLYLGYQGQGRVFEATIQKMYDIYQADKRISDSGIVKKLFADKPNQFNRIMSENKLNLSDTYSGVTGADTGSAKLGIWSQQKFGLGIHFSRHSALLNAAQELLKVLQKLQEYQQSASKSSKKEQNNQKKVLKKEFKSALFDKYDSSKLEDLFQNDKTIADIERRLEQLFQK